MAFMEGAVKLGLLFLAFAITLPLTFCGAGYSSAAGTPLPSSQHTVDLTWAASNSPDLLGYNVYRAPFGDSCGSFTRINTALVPTTSYTDSDLTNGASYCYAATAVNTSREESSYSNIVMNVQIPAN